MAQTTFQGPVRSLNGFFTQGPANVVNVTSSTTLTVADHAGKIITVGGSIAANVVLTLPSINVSANSAQSGPGSDPNNQNNQGAVFTVFIPTTVSTSSVKIGTDGTDKFVGSLIGIDSDSSNAVVGYIPGATNDFINLNGTTTGGVAGTYIQITALTTAKYMVNGVVIGSGTVATPFADA